MFSVFKLENNEYNYVCSGHNFTNVSYRFFLLAFCIDDVEKKSISLLYLLSMVFCW